MPPHFHTGKEPPKLKGKVQYRESIFEGGGSTNVTITKLKEGMLLRGANLSPRSGSGYGIAVLKKSKGPVTTFYKELRRGAELPWLQIEHNNVDAIRDHITHLDGKIGDARIISAEVDKIREEARQKGEKAPTLEIANITEMLMHRDILERTLTVLENLEKAGS